MPFEIPAEHKFFVIGFTGSPVSDGFPEALPLGDRLYVAQGPSPAPLDETWKNWMGEIDTDHYGHIEFSLVGAGASETLGVLDAEHETLATQVHALLYAFNLLGSLRFHEGQAFSAKGSRHADVVDIRQMGRPRPHYGASRFEQRLIDQALAARAYSVSQQLLTFFQIAPATPLLPGPGPRNQDHIRLRRGFNVLLKGLQAATANERLHHFVRSIDAVLKTPPHESQRKFSYRGSLLVQGSATARPELEQMYRLRSAEEHLNSWTSVGLTEATAKLRAVQAEILACDLYLTLLENGSFRDQFLSDATTDAFWGGQWKELVKRVNEYMPNKPLFLENHLLAAGRINDWA